jgi:aspartyl-tRNA(Asn)/glutamyl-tRNA(Gln) amidotransferase subunit C
MKIDRDLVSRIARLAALELGEEETEEMAAQLTRIVEHFEALRSVPDSLLGDLPAARPTPLRADTQDVGCSVPDLAANAPELSHGHFVVPRVVTREGGS